MLVVHGSPRILMTGSRTSRRPSSAVRVMPARVQCRAYPVPHTGAHASAARRQHQTARRILHHVTVSVALAHNTWRHGERRRFNREHGHVEWCGEGRKAWRRPRRPHGCWCCWIERLCAGPQLRGVTGAVLSRAGGPEVRRMTAEMLARMRGCGSTATSSAPRCCCSARGTRRQTARTPAPWRGGRPGRVRAAASCRQAAPQGRRT